MLESQAEELRNKMLSGQIEKIADHYGLEHQLSIANGELIELIHAIQDYSIKFALCDEDIGVDYIAEELADVSIMVEQLVHLLECNETYQTYRELKVKRQLLRIEQERNDVENEMSEM